MNRVTLILASLVLTALVAACGAAAVPPAAVQVTLNGANEVPAVTTDASGTATVTVVGNVMTVYGTFTGMDIGGLGAHVHGPAPADDTGPVVFSLFYDNTRKDFERIVTLTQPQLEMFQQGLLYINLHSVAHPNGEIRGQIVP
jgi:hypothetical protein